ncbi:helix-turn-helix domain-containing protein [Natronorubrum sp. JWXQ-INN-674]|uniref:Helix-turn-helix domain-containing protein n=1 Tax=Natronorubrum halalkaliphilum TaxID=2691917 RepID=A0A6B0VNT4_9EURY|nr:IclR family transcriptional regulator [Natronorubrum halalkaliphilum]MXV62636.1 helix-turn-helix domain-containing protein [Natronorubrum halalkaliphilum]
MTAPESGGIQAVDRAFDIVEALNELDGAGVSELANYVGLPKSTVHNHLSTLERAEYVVRENGSYRTSLKFLQISETARNQHELYQVARSEVDQLVEKTGEISALMTEEHGRSVFIYRSRGPEAARIDTCIGDRVPIHCTALGKAILAFLPEERRNEIIDRHGLPEVTRNTISDREVLAEELETIREEQIAYDDEERLNGLRSVAAPILDGTDSVIGSISVAGPTHRMQGERFNTELPETVLGVANVIELNIQHT